MVFIIYSDCFPAQSSVHFYSLSLHRCGSPAGSPFCLCLGLPWRQPKNKQNFYLTGCLNGHHTTKNQTQRNRKRRSPWRRGRVDAQGPTGKGLDWTFKVKPTEKIKLKKEKKKEFHCFQNKRLDFLDAGLLHLIS